MVSTHISRRQHRPPTFLVSFLFLFLHSPALLTPTSILLLCLHRCHGQNLAPLLPLQLSSHHAVDSGADGVTRLVEQDAGVVVEAHDGAVAALGWVSGSDDDGVADVAALDLCGGGDACHAGGGRAALFLDDNDDAIT
jgi:hypothetical protein